MDWNVIITTVLTSSSITALILAVMGYLSKNLFSQILSRDIERYKSDLQKTAFENQTRFQILHTKRAMIIEELYRCLVQAERDAKSLIQPLQFSGEPSQEEKFTKALNSGNSLFESFECHRIYFTKESCERIDHFLQGLRNALIDFQLVLNSQKSGGAAAVKSVDTWIVTWDNLQKELPPIKADIEKDFREILGI